MSFPCYPKEAKVIPSMSDNEFIKQKNKTNKQKNTQELFKLTSIVYNVNSLEIW